MNDYTGTLRISRQTDLQLDFLRKECEKSQTEVLITRDLSTPRVSSLQRQLSRRGLRDHGTRIGGCLGPPKLADGKHDQNRLAVMKASRSLTTYVEKLRKKKDPKKRPTSKIRSFLEVLPEK